MSQHTCLTCNSIVVPKRPLNWLLLILLNVWYLPFYFLSKKRCPKCKGIEFTSQQATSTVSRAATSFAPPNAPKTSSPTDAQQMIDIMYDVRRIGIQAMESAYIVATSKTVDTVASRYEFLLELYIGLVMQSGTPTYSLHVQQAIDQFKAVRYNTIPEAYQLQLLMNPRDFDLPEFYAQSLEGVALRSAEAHIAAIQTLKKVDAKERRMVKIKIDFQRCLQELDAHCRDAASFDLVRSRLEAANAAIDEGKLPVLSE